jgi:mevalonate kinase
MMDRNQTHLEVLSLSTPEIETMCGLARRAGALGAKLTGAGGGGCVVALVPAQAVADAVLEAWKREGLEGFAASAAPEGRPRAIESEAAP